METIYTKAVIYCRVSSDRQVREGSGLDSQEHRCRDYARSLGMEVERVFKDEGISGGLFDRPAMQSLMRHLDDNWQDKYFVIFDDLKRFARDVEVHLRLKAELRAREAKVRCLNYNFDDSAEGEFVETVFAAQNQLERKQNRRQVCQKMKARLERGYWCFYQPTGYTYYKDKEHGKLLTPVEPIAGILAEGLNAFAEERILTQTDFRNFLISKNLHGLLGRNIKAMTLQCAKRFLIQQLYAGLVGYEEWGIAQRQGHHKAIISKETYEKIQAKLARPERKPRATDNFDFPLRRIVSCSVCGKKMTSSINKGKRKYYPHYTCNNSECNANPKNIAPAKMESDYLEMLENIKVEPEVLEIGKVIATRIWEDKVKDMGINFEAKEAEGKEIEKMIDEYIDLIPKTRSDSIRTRYEAKIEELDGQLRALKNVSKNKKIPDIQEAFNLIFKFIGTPAETWKKADNKAKILIHNMIFTSNPRYSSETGFGTPELSLPFAIKQHISGNDTNLVEMAGFEPAS